jgi:hypothetical protein
VRRASLGAATAKWEEIDAKVEQLRGKGGKTLIADQIRVEDIPENRLVIFRDRNGWCPYSERVWLALMQMQLDFDEVLINLQTGKPFWYSDVVGTSQAAPPPCRSAAHQSRSLARPDCSAFMHRGDASRPAAADTSHLPRGRQVTSPPCSHEPHNLPPRGTAGLPLTRRRGRQGGVRLSTHPRLPGVGVPREAAAPRGPRAPRLRRRTRGRARRRAGRAGARRRGQPGPPHEPPGTRARLRGVYSRDMGRGNSREGEALRRACEAPGRARPG